MFLLAQCWNHRLAIPGFYIGSLDLHSRPHVHAASTLTTELSLPALCTGFGIVTILFREETFLKAHQTLLWCHLRSSFIPILVAHLLYLVGVFFSVLRFPDGTQIGNPGVAMKSSLPYYWRLQLHSQLMRSQSSHSHNLPRGSTGIWNTVFHHCERYY